jgi:protein-arginine kinase activator protein McsA
VYCQCIIPVPKTKHKLVCDECGRSIQQKNGLISSAYFQKFINDAMTQRIEHHWDYYSKMPKKKITRRQKLARKIKEMRRRLRNAQAALNGSFEADEDY